MEKDNPPAVKVMCNINYMQNAIFAIQNGLEYAKMCLQEHDIALGRTTIKNKLWAGRMEKDIREMETSIRELSQIYPSGHREG